MAYHLKLSLINQLQSCISNRKCNTLKLMVTTVLIHRDINDTDKYPQKIGIKLMLSAEVKTIKT